VAKPEKLLGALGQEFRSAETAYKQDAKDTRCLGGGNGLGDEVYKAAVQ
jgi:hypothetical protein